MMCATSLSSLVSQFCLKLAVCENCSPSSSRCELCVSGGVDVQLTLRANPIHKGSVRKERKRFHSYVYI